ncbi:MAG: type VI secretion system tip protein VgrG [Chitinivibrionales bacterium]|nr:type VI secretion system tip protein VgrG [Chitinivibrionales bacterium]
MNNSRVVPTPAPADLVTFRIVIDGVELGSEYHLVALSVTRTVNKIPSAVMTLLDGDPAQEDFPLSNSDLLVPGKQIELLAGYHSQEDTIFKGIIVSHSIKARSNKPSALTIELKDKAVGMTLGRKSKYFVEMTDSDIMEELLGAYALETDVESTDAIHAEMVQYYATDWDFLVSRADVNGKLVMVDDGKVHVTSPDCGQEAVVSLIYGSTMLEFEASLDARNQLEAVKSASWDYAEQAMIEEEGDDPQYNGQGNIDGGTLAGVLGLDSFPLTHTGQVRDRELKAWADAQLLKSRMARIIGRVKCQGIAGVKPGAVVELQGVGDRFNGNAFVTAVRHSLTRENWETNIQFGLSPEWFAQKVRIEDNQASALVPPVHGLQIGIVTALEGDPDGEHRVQVKMPVISTEDEGVWARVACVDAGDSRGVYFRPEIGDEVVLGFLNDDPRDPLVLGMLNSSAKPAPIEAADDNHEKAIVTRSELKVVFNDDEVSLTIETPNGNKIVISDNDGGIALEDENSNKIEMTSDGITFDSPSDISISSQGDVKIEGNNIEMAAQAQFKAEGPAGAELTSGAICKVEGSLVQIN